MFRVRPGYRHGSGKPYGPGDLVTLSDAEAAGFLDKLERVEDAPPAPAAEEEATPTEATVTEPDATEDTPADESETDDTDEGDADESTPDEAETPKRRGRK